MHASRHQPLSTYNLEAIGTTHTANLMGYRAAVGFSDTL